MSEMYEVLAPLIRQSFHQVMREVGGDIQTRYKADGSPVTVVDRRMQEVLTDALAGIEPTWSLLGEEMAPEEQARRIAEPGDGLWVLDPLDGTTNFAAGVPLYAVSLALLDHQGTRFGLIYDPERDECFAAERDKGAWLNHEVLCLDVGPESLGDALAVVDGKRLQRNLGAALVTRSPFSSQRNFGSVALEWCWLACGRFHVYLHGGQKLWDHAAGVLIAQEAGALVTTMAGDAIRPVDLQAKSAVGAVNEGLHHQIMQWMKSI